MELKVIFSETGAVMRKGISTTAEHILLLLTSIGQILAVILTYAHPVRDSLRNAGWIILWISGVFGVLPIITFRKYGRIKKGKSYIYTNVLVDKGIYAVMRHPQYFAGVLISIGLYLIAPGWVNLVLGALNLGQYYFGTYGEEERLQEKFGDAYSEYQKQVPRFNFVVGLWRWLKRKEKNG